MSATERDLDNNTTESRFFDIHTTGAGYIDPQRIRWVKPKKGQPYLCCSISLLRGESSKHSKPEYTRIDCRVVGGDAFGLIESLFNQIKNGSLAKDAKIFASVKIGDIYPEAYMLDGEARVMLKGRLLLVNSLYVNRVEIFKAPPAPEKK